MTKNIILIGFMGTGKTSVGRHLASLLGWNFIDTDDLIEKTEGKTINRIFQEQGEAYFRTLETKILDILADYNHFIIGSGGGIVMRDVNVEKLEKIGPLVLLSAQPEIILERLKDSNNRPLLKVENPFQKINELLNLRNSNYHDAADIEIDTSEISIDEVSREIIKKLGVINANS